MVSNVETISEEYAAELFFHAIVKRITNSWNGLLVQLRAEPAWAKSFILDDEKQAVWDLLIAVVAMDLISLDQLFPVEQAERLYNLSIAVMSSEENREYVREAIDEYTSRYRDDAAQGLDPMLAMGEILYGRWGLAGDIYKPKELFIAPNQLLAQGLAVIINSLQGIWKRIHQNYQLQ